MSPNSSQSPLCTLPSFGLQIQETFIVLNLPECCKCVQQRKTSTSVLCMMQPPIELLRQYMDMGGWYGRDNSFRTMVDVQFVAAMGTPGGGRTFITDRYLRHYNLVALSQVRTAKKACSATM